MFLSDQSVEIFLGMASIIESENIFQNEANVHYLLKVILGLPEAVNRDFLPPGKVVVES